MRIKGPKKEGTRVRFLEQFLINNRSKIDPVSIQKASKKRSPKNIEFDAKGVPKWSRNRYQNLSKINAQTGNEKDHENH